MDPTLFLSDQSFRENRRDKASVDEIDAFYAQHGSGHFVTIARWCAHPIKALNGIRIWQRGPANFAPIQQKG